MPTFVSVSEEILDDRNGCNTQKNPLEINKIIYVWNSRGNSSGRVCGCEEKFDLMTGGDKNRSQEARGLRTLALKNLQKVIHHYVRVFDRFEFLHHRLFLHTY